MDSQKLEKAKGEVVRAAAADEELNQLADYEFRNLEFAGGARSYRDSIPSYRGDPEAFWDNAVRNATKDPYDPLLAMIARNLKELNEGNRHIAQKLAGILRYRLAFFAVIDRLLDEYAGAGEAKLKKTGVILSMRDVEFALTNGRKEISFKAGLLAGSAHESDLGKLQDAGMFVEGTDGQKRFETIAYVVDLRRFFRDVVSHNL